VPVAILHNTNDCNYQTSVTSCIRLRTDGIMSNKCVVCIKIVRRNEHVLSADVLSTNTIWYSPQTANWTGPAEQCQDVFRVQFCPSSTARFSHILQITILLSCTNRVRTSSVHDQFGTRGWTTSVQSNFGTWATCRISLYHFGTRGWTISVQFLDHFGT